MEDCRPSRKRRREDIVFDPHGNILPWGVFFSTRESKYGVGYTDSKGNRSKMLFVHLSDAVDFSNSVMVAKQLTRAMCSSETTREQNLISHGNNASQERNTLSVLKEALSDHGIEVKIMNDFTVADALVKPSSEKCDSWIQVQLKTTKSKEKEGRWHFMGMAGYANMLIVCVSLDDFTVWTFDGSKMDEYVKNHAHPNIKITSGGSVERIGIVHGNGNNATASLAKNIKRCYTVYPSTTFNVASWNLSCKQQFLERWTIEVYRLLHENEGFSVEWPECQGGSFDALFVYKNRKPSSRVQFKHAHQVIGEGKSGFKCNVEKHIGKKKTGAYNSTDFDILVVMNIDISMKVVHVWEFKTRDIDGSVRDNGKVRTPVVSVGGKPSSTSLYLHLDEVVSGWYGIQTPNKNGMGRKNTHLWTIDYATTYQISKRYMPPVPVPKDLSHMNWA
jgi:hypothetical protein